MPMRYAHRVTGLLVVAILLLPGVTRAAGERVVLQLAWKHQFQFAGYYAALHKGYYRAAGLDVTLVEGGEGRFAREELLSGRAQYGIAGAELLLHRAAGEPFVVLAPIFQHSPSILLARRDSGIASLQDLVGKKVMLLPGNKDADILAAFLNEGVRHDQIDRIDHTYRLSDLIEGRIGAVSAYLTNEPWLLETQGVTPQVISPRTYGVDYYSDCLFTSSVEVEKRPRRVAAMLKASLAGWQYAMEHPDEIIDLLIDQYGVTKTRDHLHFEAAATRSIMRPELIKIGHMNPGRWRHIASTYARLGMMQPDLSLEGFLYQPAADEDYAWLINGIRIATAVIVLLSAAAFILYRFNRKLSAEIEERNRFAEALKASEAKFRLLFEHADVLVSVYDQKGVCLLMNRKTASLFGGQPEAFIGMHFVELHPDQGAEYLRRIQEVIATGDSKEYEDQVHFPGGSRWLLTIVDPVPDAGGRIHAAQLISQDITERVKAINDLRKSESLLAILLDTVPVPVFYKDTEGRYLGCNAAFQKFFNKNRAEIIGQTVHDLHPEAQATAHDAKDRALLASGGIQVYEDTLYDSDGSAHTVIMHKSVYSNEAGETLGLIGAFLDISERKQAEKERERLQRQVMQAQRIESIGNLAGGIAHDFNNILASIIGFTELAIDATETGKVRNHLQEIFKAGLRAKTLVDQILTFARQAEEETRPIRVYPIVEEVLKFMRASIPANVEIQHTPPCDGVIMGNAAQIHQVVMNLCTNAAQAMEASGGILEVAMRVVDHKTIGALSGRTLAAGQYVEIEVRDNGYGISEEILSKIYDPYFTTKPIGEGSGMGLAVVHGIVESHRGRIDVASQVGRGTSVRVFLPIVKASVSPQATEQSELPSGTERILFVDDEAPLTQIAARMLTQLGYRVRVHTSSEDAWETFQAEPEAFDLIITDMTMPKLTGDELATRILALRPQLPVILCTGYSRRITEARVREIGIRVMIQKPIVQARLAKIVRQVLDTPQTPTST